MTALPAPRSPPSPTQSEYQSAIQFYSTVRDNNTLKEADDIGGRPFVLVSNVTSALLQNKNGHHSEQHGQISRLLAAAYRRRHYRKSLQTASQILEFLPIFYTLLDLDLGHKIHKFVEEGISELPIELPKLRKLFSAKKQEQRAEKFYKQQWQWCAMRFEWRMSRKAASHEHIVPITARTKIEPTRDVLPKTDRKASLWVVEVPTSFVGKTIQQKLGSPDDSVHGENGTSTSKADSRYRFVIKRFSEQRKWEFEREKTIYNIIGEKEGIVQCIGWYTHCERDNSSNVEATYYNLVLELGDQDLYSAFQKENPPMTFMEIQSFWQSMFNVAHALASIQVLHDELHTDYLWHGDIKPENILDVKGRFKLADPGEAQLKTVSIRPGAETDEVAKIPVPGGTRSFAAPEKFTYDRERSEEPEVTQGSDIWSLGCVFSVAATYVVLGKEGVKQYRLLRISHIKSLGIGIGDPFHNKVNVLPVVTHWHQYLRSTIRKDDCFTSKILDLVDGQMLITPGEKRISGTALSQELRRIDGEAAPSTNGFQDYIAEFIDKVAYMSKGGISQLEDVPRTISESGTELFSEQLLYPSRRSEGRPIARPDQPNRENLFCGIGTGLDPSPVLVPQQFSEFFTPEQRAYTSLASNSQTRTLPKPQPQPDPPTTFWEVEADMAEFKANSQGYSLNNYLRRRSSVYGKPLGGKEDQLKHHFRNRDLVYLVDNASTMKSFWGHASYLLKVLVARSLGYDDNGMELQFTNDPDRKWRLNPKKNQNEKEFLKKMHEADPNKRKHESPLKTDMSASLSLILEDHLNKNRDRDGRRLKRHLTILVLTDGLWGVNGERDVDDYLVTFIRRIPEENWEPKRSTSSPATRDNPPSRPRPISIQFIRFGHHPSAITRLDRLDNHLKDRPELVGASIPDIIDTEDANMDVYKMFLGSFIEDFDNKAIQGATVVSSASGHSVTPPASAPEMNGMSLAEHEIVQSPTHLTPATIHTGPFTSDMRPQLSVPYTHGYPSPRPSRMSSEIIPGASESAQTLPPERHSCQWSGGWGAAPRGGGTFGPYLRARGTSHAQQSPTSPLLHRTTSSDPFNIS